MGFPKDVRVVETMIGTRAGELAKLNYTNLTGMKDKETEGFNFPAQYMFKDVPWSDQARNVSEEPEPPQGADLLLPYMDKHNIQIAMVGVGPGDERSAAREAIENYPDRFIGCHEPDPNDVMGSIHTIRKLFHDGHIRAISAFPAGRVPQVPINDPKMYAIYATCVELDIPIFCCAGIPGPRVPYQAQHVKLIDEVM